MQQKEELKYLHVLNEFDHKLNMHDSVQIGAMERQCVANLHNGITGF